MPFEKKKESLPQLQIGVRENGNIRTKKLAAPRCPVSDPLSPYYDEYGTSCQTETAGWPGWWKLCEKREHEPYFTIRKKTVEEDDVDDDGYVKGTKKRVITTKKLNVVQVPIGTRFHSGRGEAISKGLKGRRDLGDFGYNEKCEYRNCELDVKLQSKYGKFCGDRHARLIGADVESVMLHVKPGQRSKQLREIDVEFEGIEVLQTPPDVDEPVFEVGMEGVE